MKNSKKILVFKLINLLWRGWCMAYCDKCGNNNPEDAEYCSKCGISMN